MPDITNPTATRPSRETPELEGVGRCVPYRHDPAASADYSHERPVAGKPNVDLVLACFPDIDEKQFRADLEELGFVADDYALHRPLGDGRELIIAYPGLSWQEDWEGAAARIRNTETHETIASVSGSYADVEKAIKGWIQEYEG